ncbi:DNA-binding NarL/FixJ family response regulator [Catenuloplanes nepalensis]|uniref:DNA-binding NarL/FixJ family response regulator n=1 Tax=Catenuloplanes nepalensis TaxID=587533 RepID=A0ABT9MPY4_9ACTN|nr:response regulator transcription factor [Catenuloplanes nepalensis]MDP9793477.1 DNA-binding NarL/FixJ family response regulator [Catenuloplanes nepalensis]
MISVLVVDDQPMIRAGIRAILDAQPDLAVAGEAEDGRAGVRLGRSLRPDVVLMDVRMPELDGLAATRELLSGSPAPRVLMLTTFDVDDYVYEALRSGASGFLLKDSEPDELVRAVRVVANSEALLSPSVTRRLIENFVGAQPRKPSPALNALTDREREVLRHMATGMSNAEIAAALFIAEQTTKTHVSRILNKLGLRDRVHAVVFGYENGLVVPGRR